LRAVAAKYRRKRTITFFALIGENPRLFGFDFDNPLATSSREATRSAGPGKFQRAGAIDPEHKVPLLLVGCEPFAMQTHCGMGIVESADSYPCYFRAVWVALHRKQVTTCHLLPCKLLKLDFHADSIPSALTVFSTTCRSRNHSEIDQCPRGQSEPLC